MALLEREEASNHWERLPDVDRLELCERLALTIRVPLEDLIAHPEKFLELHLTPITV